MSMETKAIVRVNNVDIVATSDEQRLVPVKPICEALGVDVEGQRQHIKRDEILNSVAVVIKATAKDNKTYDTTAIPLRYVFGWLFTIDTSRVNPEIRESVVRYKRECYDALYNHFTARTEFVEQKQREIDRQLTIVEEAKEHFKSAKTVLTDAEAKLKKLRTLTMEDYDMERRQLKLDF